MHKPVPRGAFRFHAQASPQALLQKQQSVHITAPPTQVDVGHDRGFSRTPPGRLSTANQLHRLSNGAQSMKQQLPPSFNNVKLRSKWRYQ
jgi:hypothetical protein